MRIAQVRRTTDLDLELFGGFIKSYALFSELLFRQHVFDATRDDDADIQALMEGPVKDALGLPGNIIHGQQGGAVFSYLYEDFMKPVTTVGKKVELQDPKIIMNQKENHKKIYFSMLAGSNNQKSVIYIFAISVKNVFKCIH